MQYTLHITNDCNFACDYCKIEKKHSFMTEQTAFLIADRALNDAKRDGQKVSCISFYGGEPLLHKSLIYRTVNYCKRISDGTGVRFTYRMTTNGLLLDEMFLGFAVENQIKIALSIDGTREVHDKHRRTPSGEPTFDSVSVRAKKLLVCLPKTYAMMTVNPDTSGNLLESVLFLYEMGFQAFVTTPNLSVKWTAEEIHTLGSQYMLLADWYAERLLDGQPLKMPLFDGKLLSHLAPQALGGKCIPGAHRVSVSVDGGLFPCIQYSYHEQYKIGSAAADISKDALDKIREKAGVDIATCVDCAFNTRCDNKCGCRNLVMTGSLTKVSPEFCAHERMLIPIADALGEKIFYV